MVWVDFLYLPGLLQGTSLLQRSMPDCRENEKITVKPKDGIAEPIKVKKPTAKPKIAAGMA